MLLHFYWATLSTHFKHFLSFFKLFFIYLLISQLIVILFLTFLFLLPFHLSAIIYLKGLKFEPHHSLVFNILSLLSNSFFFLINFSTYCYTFYNFSFSFTFSSLYYYLLLFKKMFGPLKKLCSWCGYMHWPLWHLPFLFSFGFSGKVSTTQKFKQYY